MYADDTLGFLRSGSQENNASFPFLPQKYKRKLRLSPRDQGLQGLGE